MENSPPADSNESSTNASSTSDSVIGSAELMSPSPATHPHSSEECSFQYWPLPYSGPMVQMVPVGMVSMLLPFPQAEQCTFYTWVPINADGEAVFNNPHLWPYCPQAGVPSCEEAAQTMMNSAEEQDSSNTASENLGYSAQPTATVPVFSSFQDSQPSMEEKREISQVESGSKASNTSIRSSEEGLRMLADLAVARNLLETQNAVRSGNTD